MVKDASMSLGPYGGAETRQKSVFPSGIPFMGMLSKELQEQVGKLSDEHKELLIDYIEQRLKVARESDPLGEWMQCLTRDEDCEWGDSQYGFALDGARVKFGSGGNRSGKTMVGCGTDVVIWSPDPYPEWWPERYRHTKDKPRFIWVACIDRNIQIEPGGVQDTILSLIPPGQIRSKSKIPGHSNAIQLIEGWDGSKIIFKVYGAGHGETFQTAGLHHLHFDEEPPEDVYIEAQQRGLETGMTTIVTYTPVKGVTWIYERYVDSGIVPVHFFSTEDNPIIDIEALDEIDVGLTKIEKLIRRRGKTIPLVGKPRFDAMAIAEWMPNMRKPPMWVELTTNPDNPDGPPIITEYEDPQDAFMPMALYIDPRQRRKWTDRFVIGVDSSDGVPSGDEQAAFVYDRHLNREAAICHGRWDLEKTWCPFIKMLSMFFGDCFVNPERNNQGVLLVKYLVNSGTPLYIQEKMGSSLDEFSSEFGWYTTVQAKSQAEAHLVTALNQLGKGFFLYYEALLNQLMTYERKPTGVGAAAAGCMDDIVTALLLSLQMELQAPAMIDPKRRSQMQEKEVWDRARHGTGPKDGVTYMGA